MAVSILKTTESACKSLVDSLNIAGLNVYKGMDDEHKQAPCVIVKAESLTEDFPNSGIYRVKTNVRVKEMVPETSETSTLSESVQNVFVQSNIQSILSNQVAGYSVLAVFVDGGDESTDGDAQIEDMSFEIVCGLTA